MTNERQRLFASQNVPGVFAYNQRFPDRALPAVLVVIDNLQLLRENYDLFLEQAVIPLVRRSGPTGIAFACSASSPAGLPGKLVALFGTSMTFRQNDPTRYLDIVGRGAVDFGDTAGRGYIRRDGRALLFHAALPVGLDHQSEAESESSLDDSSEVGVLARSMQRRAERLTAPELVRRPAGVEVLPDSAPLKGILELVGPPSRNRVEAVVGLESNLLPARFDLRRSAPHFVIGGPSRSGSHYAFAQLVAVSGHPSLARTLRDSSRRFAAQIRRLRWGAPTRRAPARYRRGV
jgi:DNA segregation ATPase FtsK/SpoIIIE-like protein